MEAFWVKNGPYPGGFSRYGRNTAMRFRFHAKQTSVHSWVTFSRPRSKNWRKPIPDLMIPKTGSTAVSYTHLEKGKGRSDGGKMRYTLNQHQNRRPTISGTSSSVHWYSQGKQGQGTISTDTGALKAYPYGCASRFEDHRRATNPGAILGAAHAACFTMAFSFACDKAGLATTAIDTQASVRLSKQGEGFVIDRIAPVSYTHLDVYKRQGFGIGLMLIIDLILLGPIGLTLWAVQMLWIPFFAAGVINGIGHYLSLIHI